MNWLFSCLLFFSSTAWAVSSEVEDKTLWDGIEKILIEIDQPLKFNPQTCPTYINTITDYLFYMPASQFIPTTPAAIQDFKDEGVQMIKRIFQIRLKLRERLQAYDQQHELTPECLLKLREAFQYARFTEEYLLEWLVHNQVLNFTVTPILAGESPFVLLNPNYSELQILPGDVFLIRGKSYVSAMIARIGDEEGNFSHMAVVGTDEAGALYVVESLIEKGVVVTPLQEWRESQDARVVLYRPKDPQYTPTAARAAYQWGRTHPRYDFAMNDDDYSQAFCSEVVRYAYDKGSNGTMILPKYRSHLTKFKDTTYLQNLGIRQDTLFAPYDIEVDPRFELVAEGRYYPLLRQVRMQDSVLQSIYSWMIQGGYQFQESWWIDFQAYVGKFLRYLGFFKDLMPTYMPLNTMKTTLKFEVVAEALEKNLYKKEEDSYRARGYLPSFQDMMKLNEEFRYKDCQNFKEGKRSAFHKIFHNTSCVLKE